MKDPNTRAEITIKTLVLNKEIQNVKILTQEIRALEFSRIQDTKMYMASGPNPMTDQSEVPIEVVGEQLVTSEEYQEMIVKKEMDMIEIINILITVEMKEVEK